MKKVIALLLVFIMVLALYGCGGSKKIDVKETLISGTWQRVEGNSSYEFYKTGTGSFKSGENSGITAFNIKWTELEDNCVRVELSAVMGISGTFDYEIVWENGEYYLRNVANNGDDYILEK